MATPKKTDILSTNTVVATVLAAAVIIARSRHWIDTDTAMLLLGLIAPYGGYALRKAIGK
jgi:hypothetical protein